MLMQIFLFVVIVCGSLLLSRMDGEFKNWKWLLLCLSLIIINILLICKYFPQSGWDFQIYTSAVRAYEHGYNPYLVSHLRNFGNYFKDFPFHYLPLSLFFFKLFCFGNPQINYYVFWLSLLVATYLIIKQIDSNFKPLYLVTLLMTAFYATLCNFWAGNIGLVEMFGFVIILYFILRKKYYLSAFSLALLGIFKMIPLIFSVLYIFSDISKREKVKVITLAIISFILLSILSYALFPDITPYYYMTITGKISYQDHAIREEGNQANPAPFFFIRGITKYLFGSNPTIFFGLCLLFITALFVFFLSYIRRNRPFLKTFCLGTIPLMLILPRLKDYAFTMLIPCIYLLTKDLDLKRRTWTLLIVSAGPLILWGIDKIVCEMPAWYLLQRMLDYRQAVFLILFYILFLVNDSAEPANQA